MANFFSTATDSFDTTFFSSISSFTFVLCFILTDCDVCRALCKAHSLRVLRLFIFILFALCLCTRALCLRAYGRFTFRRQRDSRSLFTNFIMLLRVFNRTVHSTSEWAGDISGRKRRHDAMRWKRTTSRIARQMHGDDQLSTTPYSYKNNILTNANGMNHLVNSWWKTAHFILLWNGNFNNCLASLHFGGDTQGMVSFFRYLFSN